MSDVFVLSEEAIALARAAISVTLPGEDTDAPLDAPAVVDWLARLRLLEGVPFPYLVPHEQLLPRESIRFFYLNRNWTDTACQGALCVGAATTRERAQLRRDGARLREAVDRQERNVRAAAIKGDLVEGAGEVVTGFLLRSRAVSGWPGLHVRAYRDAAGDAAPMRLLRLERLAPAVLLALIDGVPGRVEVEEPRQGVQFGVDGPDRDVDPGARWVKLRTADGHPAEDDRGRQLRARVPFRRGSPGVVDVRTLAQRIERQGPVGAVSPAEFALQLLQFPFRQVFGDVPSPDDQPTLVVTVPFSLITVAGGTDGR